MNLTEQQQHLFDFVKQKHGEQKRKYTGEPYWQHLLNVANVISAYEKDCIEIALCHDLFEDTTCNFNELYNAMIKVNYSRDFSYHVCTCVTELTDKFTKEDYPYLNREKRKVNECKRLSEISYKSQSVKYADLIDNTSSIVENDKDFAEVYLKEKEDVLKVMNKGNHDLYNHCCSTLTNGCIQLD